VCKEVKKMALAGTQTSETLAQRVIPRRGILENTWVYNLLLTFGGSWFVAILAQISIPLGFTPVPITGQTLGVLLVGSLLGTRLGTIALLLYVAQGAIGFPFFADGGSGVEVLYGATAGYILGFVLAAALTGWLAERGWDKRVSTTILSMLLGTLLIYVPGVLWLSTLVGGLGAAMVAGVLPFLPGAAIKIAVAAGVLPGGWKLLGSDKQRD
jgi:biotin transport system substrate-specific component